jgi:hypothetical protein
MKIKSINQKEVVTNYPYGRLECEATFSLEFSPKKGFRSVFQTVNPKTGRLNAPKKSTYSTFAFMHVADNGHVKFGGYNISGYEDVNKVFKFISDNEKELQLTSEMIEFLSLSSIACIKGNAYYTQCDTKKLLSIIEEPVKNLLGLVKKNPAVKTSDIFINTSEIQKIKEDYKLECI